MKLIPELFTGRNNTASQNMDISPLQSDTFISSKAEESEKKSLLCVSQLIATQYSKTIVSISTSDEMC